MTDAPVSQCRRCGVRLRADEPLCPRCLLAAAAEDSCQVEDNLFQQALAFEPGARRDFICQATPDNQTLRHAVLLLLEGYEQAGGDAAAPTQPGAPTSRAQWVGSEQPGMVINHFRLLSHLGEGGMGSVWRAQQITPVRRTVALKLIKLGMDTREVIKRFERERQTLALLNHPNIAQVFEAGDTTWGRPYFAMELVEGQPITAHCRRAGLGLTVRLDLFREVCAAVEHAHQKGVIHRDLKPSNILVTAGGTVKVIDFGVAKATQGAGDLFLTQQTRIVGTPAYMSPEQALSGGIDVDTRTDVYALGVLLYELLTETLPIDADRLAKASLPETLRFIQEEDPPTPSGRIRSLARNRKTPGHALPSWHPLPPDLDRVVMKAIRKDRNERYASAAALSEDLRRFLANEPVAAAPPTMGYHVGKFIRRHRVIVGAGAVVLAALVGALVLSLFEVHQTNQALAGEAKARRQVTLTLSDMYTRSGLVAAEKGDPSRAELWFANAALLAAADPDRAAADRLRAATWRRDAMTAVRAFETGFEHLRELSWNPRRAALIAQGEAARETQIWDLETEQQWPPAAALARGVAGAAWAPSGQRLALALTNGDVLILEFPSGKSAARLTHANATCLGWSPDERWVATGRALWQWHSNKVAPLPETAERLRFSRDGRFLLLQWSEKATICAAADLSRFLFPPVPTHFGARSDFIGDGANFVVGLPKGGLAVRDSTTGALVHAETNSAAAPEYDGLPLAVSPDGRLIARRSRPALNLRDFSAAAYPDNQGLAAGASFSPDNSLLASGGYDNRLELWSPADGKFLGEVGHHHTGVINVEFSPDGRFVASGEDGLVRIWRVRRQNLVRKINAGAPTRAVLSADGKYVAAAGFGNRGGAVKQSQLFSVATGQPVGPPLLPGGLLMDALFGPGDAWLALAVSTTPDRSDEAFARSPGSGNVQFWNPFTGRPIGGPVVLPSEPRGLALHPSGHVLAVCCAGGQAVEINLADHALHTLFDDYHSMNADGSLNNGRCAYAADGRVLVVWGFLDFTHLWDRDQNRNLIPPHERDATTFDVALRANILARAVVAPSMRIEFSSLDNGQAAAPAIAYVNWPLLTRFNAAGDLLLTAGGGKTAEIWDWRRGQLVCPALPHDDTIMAGCFLAATPWVATGAHDGKIKFWDSRTGMMIRPPLEFDGWVLDLQETPDSRTLVADGLADGGIELVSLEDALAGPDLSADAARLLSEIDADAEVHPSGGLAPLTPQAWLGKWREFRKLCPNFPEHRLDQN